MDGDPFVLVVCTGNICRSPAAALLLRAALGSAPGLRVVSAGTAAVIEAPVAEPMAVLLRKRGIDVSGHLGRQFDPAEARSADVVLTMTAAQRSTVVTRLPAAVRRTFTLSELVELARLAGELPGTPADRLAALVAQAPRLRALRTGPRDDDIEDPYGRPDEVYSRVLSRIDAAVAELLDVLLPRSARSA